MDHTEFADNVREENRTPLSRLGSSKALYADTEGEMDDESVLAAAADRAHHAAETFATWADEESDEAADLFDDAAGTERVVELHGTHRYVSCDDCGDRRPADPVFEQAADGDLPPRCDCGGVYRPDVVLFGEALPDAAMNEAQRLARDSDVFLAVGSSLSVRPASLLPKIAADAGATLVVVNYDETPRDGDAAFVLRADVTEALPALVERV